MEALSLTMSSIFTNSSWQHADFVPKSLGAGVGYAAAERLPEFRDVAVSKANSSRSLDAPREFCNSHRQMITKFTNLPQKYHHVRRSNTFAKVIESLGWASMG
jgi:hypothetical protein